MDRGNIPGFWYDKDKKKYFKIQADHLLPSESQYSESKVKKQRRKAKRQKLVQREARSRDRQTVRRSRICEDPSLGGIGLRRELGLTSSSLALQLSDATLVSQMRCSRLHVISLEDLSRRGPLRLLDAQYLPDSRLLMTTDVGGQEYIHHMPQHSSAERFYRISIWKDDTLPLRTSELPRVSKPKRNWGFCYDSGRFAAFFGCHTPGIAIAGDDDDGQCNHMRHYDDMVSEHAFDGGFLLKQSATLDISIQESTGYLAIREFENVSIHDRELRRYIRLPVGNTSGEQEERDVQFCPTIDWLDCNIVAFGDNDSAPSAAVVLWDTRFGSGQVVRFNVCNRITGIRAADHSGCRLFVSSNHLIYLFDTRCGTSPLMTFRHVHEGPQCQMATNKQGLIAAVDHENIVQVYSIWTRGRIGSLSMPRHPTGFPAFFESHPIRQLKWYDGEHGGPGLTACQGGSVLQWTWQEHSGEVNDVEPM